MSDFINGQKPQLEKITEFLKKELAGLRIGRATPALVEDIKVDAYGALTPLRQVASISIADPKTLTIQPWDKNLLKPIESALAKADLGTNPMIRENVIIISLPGMTEETRLAVIKKMHQKLEEAKVSVKGVREKIKEQVLNEEKAKLIGEDDKFKRLEELDEMVKALNEQIKQLGEKKEAEIKQI